VNKTLSTFLKFAVFLGVGLTILYLLYTSQDAAYRAQCVIDNIPEEQCSLMQKLIDDFKSTNLFWIGAVLLAFTISNISRAIRWNMLIRPLGYAPRLINSFLVIIVAYFANLGLPRIGEVVRGAMIAQYEKIPVEKAMGTIVTDRIVDVLSLLSVIGLAFILQFDTLWGYLKEQLGNGDEADGGGSIFSNPIVMVLLAGILAIAVLFFALRKKIKESAFFQKIRTILKGFGEGLQSIRKLERPGWFLFHSLNIWLMYFLMTYFCFFSFAPTAHLGPVAGLMVFVFGAFGIVIPTPGGMGSFHFLAMAALALYGINEADAFSFSNILFFSVQIGCNVLLGCAALLLLPIINKHYDPKVPTANKSTSENVLL
jgi:glycosyltransferase 2 family protein